MASRGILDGADRGEAPGRRVPPAEEAGRLYEGAGATTAAPLRPEPRGIEGGGIGPERVVAFGPGSRLGSPGDQATLLGGARLGARAEDAGGSPLDRLGRSVRAEAVTPAQGPLEARDRGPS